MRLHLSHKLIKAKQPAEFRINRADEMSDISFTKKKEHAIRLKRTRVPGEIGGRYRRRKTLPSFFLFTRIPDRSDIRHKGHFILRAGMNYSRGSRRCILRVNSPFFFCLSAKHRRAIPESGFLNSHGRVYSIEMHTSGAENNSAWSKYRSVSDMRNVIAIPCMRRDNLNCPMRIIETV